MNEPFARKDIAGQCVSTADSAKAIEQDTDLLCEALDDAGTSVDAAVDVDAFEVDAL